MSVVLFFFESRELNVNELWSKGTHCQVVAFEQQQQQQNFFLFFSSIFPSLLKGVDDYRSSSMYTQLAGASIRSFYITLLKIGAPQHPMNENVFFFSNKEKRPNGRATFIASSAWFDSVFNRVFIQLLLWLLLLLQLLL